MSKKLLLLMLLALLIGTLNLASRVEKAKASGTIYIRADGSIDPPDAPISTFDNVTYTLTGNITSDADGIVVERGNVVVDGVGYAVQGAGAGTGFSLAADNVTVRNTCVQKFRYGIVTSSIGCTVINNIITYNVKWGIYLGSSDNRIISNRVADTGLNLVGYDIVGIYCGYGSDNNTITDNQIEKNGYDGSGILLYSSSDNTITGNNITNHDYAGIYLGTLSGNVIYHNNFINNYYQVSSYYSANTWDSGYPSGGNYWSNYAGVDLKSGFYQNETGSDGIGDAPYAICADNQDNYPLMHPWSPLPVHNIYTGLGYATIQEAINANETLSGHTIFVEAGTYYENVFVNKTVSLVGENIDDTIIDCESNGSGVLIVANGVYFACFTVTRCDIGVVVGGNYTTVENLEVSNCHFGVWISQSAYCTVSECRITNQTVRKGDYEDFGGGGLLLDQCIFCNAAENSVDANELVGIWVQGSFNLIEDNTVTNSIIGLDLDEVSNCTVTGNNISNNAGGIECEDAYYSLINANTICDNTYSGISLAGSYGNLIYDNSFINNTKHVEKGLGLPNTWDRGYPSGGNYWSDYNGIDLYSGPYQNLTGSDGLGDTNYIVDANNTDHYPLMGLHGSFSNSWNCAVDVVSNSSISEFDFSIVSPSQATLSFKVTGDTGTSGFCRVCIPKALINGSYAVKLDGVLVTEPQVRELPCSNDTYEYLYINYTHSGHTIEISGPTTIPEFGSLIIMPLLMIATLLAVIAFKRTTKLI